MIDGRATLPEFADGRASRLDQVNLELSAAEPGGAVVLDGTLALNGQPLRVDARFGRLTQERSSTLRLELSTEGLGEARREHGDLRRAWSGGAPMRRACAAS